MTLLVVLSACGAGSTSAAPRPVTVPRPDLCAILDRRTVGAALLGKVTDCEGGADGTSYSVQFTGSAVVRGRKTPTTLTVNLVARYEPRTGMDLWTAFEEPRDGRVRMIGVGDMAVFQGKAAPDPQLVVVSKNLILTFALVTGRLAVPQAKLSAHLLDLANATLDAVPR